MAIGTKKVRKNGKVYTYARDYKEEYKERSPEQKKNKTIRAQARRKMEKKHGKAAIKGKDIDHKNGIGAGNGEKNLRIMSPSKNRARKSTRWR